MKRLIFIYLILCLFSPSVYTQVYQPQFSDIEAVEGEYIGKLNMHIQCIEADQKGYMWLGSVFGLFRYDGYQLEQFQYDRVDPNSLSNNHVSCIKSDLQGNLWIGTQKGLNLWDASTKSFTRFLEKDQQSNNIFVRDIEVDPDGKLWLATSDGLYHYTDSSFTKAELSGLHGNVPFAIEAVEDYLWISTQRGLLRYYPHSDNEEAISIPAPLFEGNPRDIIDVLQWNDTLLYIATYTGVMGINLLSRTIFPIDVHTDLKFERQSTIVGAFSTLVMDIERADNKLWIAYRFLGLAWYEPATGKRETFVHDPSNAFSLLSDRVYGLYYDSFKNLWVGSIKGVQLYDVQQNIKTYVLQPGFLNSENFISSIFRDSQNRYWFGTAQGLYRSQSWGQKPVKLTHGGTSIHNLRTKDATVFTEDLNGNVWIGGNTEGLHLVKYGADRGKRVNISPEANRMFSVDMEADKTDPDIIWISTIHCLLRYHISQNKIDSLSGMHQILNKSNTILRLENNYLWGANKLGFYRLNTQTLDLVVYLKEHIGYRGYVHSFQVEDAQTVWLGSSNGLQKINLNTMGITTYEFSSGSPSQDIYSIRLTDGYVWFNSMWKIHRLNKTTGEIETFGLSKNANQYFYKDVMESMEHSILFGGADGITAVNTKGLNGTTEKKITPDITRITIGDSIITDMKNDHIALASDQNAISFSFSALYFKPESNVYYQYRLLGLSDNWVFPGTRHVANFSNLDHGTYTFQVALAGDNNNFTQITFTIAPPYWETWWFRTIILLLSLTAIWVLVRLNYSRKKLKQKRLLAEQKSAYKSKFLANMSHEIRTPLNAIVGLNKLLADSDLNPKQQKWVKAIDQSSENLMRMVNDILDQERIESGNYQFVEQEFNLLAIVHQVVEYFELKAQSKGLRLICNSEESIPENVTGDPIRLTQILSNLVGNAVKFTDKGEISLSTRIFNLTKDRVKIQFVIQDSGIGIPKAKLSKIFDSFEQVRVTDRNIDEGVGLGLSIARQLVEQNNGSIEVKSDVGVGTCFTVILPFGLSPEKRTSPARLSSNGTTRENLKFLLVEDMELNRMLAIELLQRNYKNAEIDIAENGKAALKKLEDNGYDLILMDVKMPVMDGYESALKIRRNKQLDHLPILAMTANAIEDQIQKCFEAGMNDCLTKPIDEAELREKINALVK